MVDKKIIAVAGASGAQGGGLARVILADPNGGFACRAVTRDPNKDAIDLAGLDDVAHHAGGSGIPGVGRGL